MSLQEEECCAARTLLNEIDDSIQMQTQRKADAEEHAVSLQELAWARHEAGNEFGALLSMRKAHTWLVRAERIEAVLVQLQDIRGQVEFDRNDVLLAHSNRSISANLTRRRRAMVLILSKLKKANSSNITHMPTDDELMDQLLEIMDMGEI